MSDNRVAFGDENRIFSYFLLLFYKYLASEFFSGINSKLIQFSVFFPKELEITGTKTYLVSKLSKVLQKVF